MDKKTPNLSGAVEVDLSLDPAPPHNALVAEFLSRKLPEKMWWIGDRPFKAPDTDPPAAQIETREQAVHRVANKWVDAMLGKPGPSSGEALVEITNVTFLHEDIDPEKLKSDLPYNTERVVPGGYAILTVSEASPKAHSLEVDRPKLAKDLAAHERLRPLRQAFGRAYLIVANADSHVLASIGEQIDRALTTGMSAIMSSGELQRHLAPALDIRGKPANEARATRAANQALAEGARKADQDRPAPAAPAPDDRPVDTKVKK